MKKLIVTLLMLIPVAAFSQPQVQESMSPIVKKSPDSFQFTLTSQSVQQVSMKLDDLIAKKADLEKTVENLQAQIAQATQMIADAKHAGVQTLDEIEADKKLVEDQLEALRAAKVLASKAEAAASPVPTAAPESK